MVVVDSSALIPLAWIGRLDLITAIFDNVRTTQDVKREVLIDGKRGTAVLTSFLDDLTIHESPSNAEQVASLDGITVADASVILLAENKGESLLANDKGLITVAQSHGVECWWVTTVLLRCTKDEVVTTQEASNILYDLVDGEMNLHPKVYTKVQKELRRIGTES